MHKFIQINMIIINRNKKHVIFVYKAVEYLASEEGRKQAIRYVRCNITPNVK